MCRLYGFLANQPTKVECTLVHAQNALLIQSQKDLSGLSHTDGWGIGYYKNEFPGLVRRDTAAYRDLHFSHTVEGVYARTIVAHIRRATVGGISVENTHPFTFGRWLFAHNGTLGGFAQIRRQLEQETAASLQQHRKGSTDSEQAFLWLLSGMARSGIDLDSPLKDPGRLTRFLVPALGYLARLCHSASSEEATRLNFILTDGDFMVASRWNRSLFWVDRRGIRDCEICGIPHIEEMEDPPYQAVVIASEPISHEDWREVPNRSLLVVEQNRSPRLVELQVPTGKLRVGG